MLVAHYRKDKMMRCPTLTELPKPPADKSGWPWTEESKAVTRLDAEPNAMAKGLRSHPGI